jgi:type I restriction enzyme S subunit
MKLPYPPVEQQEKIARILDQADEELNLERRNLAALKEQKKGLMQQLLTGKVRVKS